MSTFQEHLDPPFIVQIVEPSDNGYQKLRVVPESEVSMPCNARRECVIRLDGSQREPIRPLVHRDDTRAEERCYHLITSKDRGCNLIHRFVRDSAARPP